jgi:hypothetical protein
MQVPVVPVEVLSGVGLDDLVEEVAGALENSTWDKVDMEDLLLYVIDLEISRIVVFKGQDSARI